MNGKSNMYIQDTEIENDTLKQGDIISQLHFLGAIKLSAIVYNSDYKGNKVGWQIPGVPHCGDAIVLSHSCEISKSNSIKLTSIILCPIRDINTATAKEKIDELIQGNIVNSDKNASYLKYFYLEPNIKLEYKNGAVADFSKLFSVRNDSYDYILQHKILQLKSDIVHSLSLKLAAYFHRSQSPNFTLTE